MKKKQMLKKIWKMYAKSKQFNALSLDQQESGQEKGYKGIEDVVWRIVQKETKRFQIDYDDMTGIFRVFKLWSNGLSFILTGQNSQKLDLEFLITGKSTSITISSFLLSLQWCWTPALLFLHQLIEFLIWYVSYSLWCCGGSTWIDSGILRLVDGHQVGCSIALIVHHYNHRYQGRRKTSMCSCGLSGGWGSEGSCWMGWSCLLACGFATWTSPVLSLASVIHACCLYSVFS